MKLPRDWSGRDVAAGLSRLDFQVTRETGSHRRFTTTRGGEHHLTIPDHASLRASTLSSFLREVEEHHGLAREAVLTIMLDQ